MAYYLGMDSGGSKTFVVITDETGTIVGKGRGGGGNHQLGKEPAFHSMRESVRLALEDAKLTKEDITYAVFGLAGADREADYNILTPFIDTLGFKNSYICGDAMIAMRAGTTQADGVVLLCGSGLNCVGMNRSGDVFQCGGFGYAFGDFGGGYGLATEVFRSVIRNWEGRGQATMLTELTLQELGYNSVQAMFNDFLDRELPIPLQLAKLLMPASQAGDEVAKQILLEQGEELGLAAAATIERLNMQQDTFDIVLAGSVLTRGQDPTIENRITEVVGKVAPNHGIRKLQVEPLVGAIYMAMERAGTEVSSEAYDKLSQFLMD
ncbi:ATPase [Paenibacillus sp. N1-5-1-14]|uniref:N-acetylglucosamine kinase n=1 Tax=Paenibacillus radicibacter TaxID=2972488 RepID=UPI0021597141|nr:BadF/BadG/BcrA/BcrD ATPase family protein [Paenibacillus radicibacter]MCR8643091.1 ATPase [Paenibacillus radicibacter]